MRLPCFIFLLLFISGSINESFSQTEQRKAMIKNIIGSVKIRRSGTVNWVDARVKMTVKERDAIRTFVESDAELETTEGTIIKVGENSTLELSRLREKNGAQDTRIKILNGSLVSNVKKLVSTKSSFEFETPTATAAIRGTVVGFDVSREHTQIKVYEGKVLVTPSGSRQGTELINNQMATVVKGQKDVKIEKFDEKPPVPIGELTTQDSSKIASADSIQSDTLTVTQETDSSATDSSVQTSGSENDSIYEPDDAVSDSIPDESMRDTVPADTVQKTVSEIRLTLNSPSDRFVCSPSSPVSFSGTVFPSGTSVTVNGIKAPVSSSGSFRININAPAVMGESEIMITAEYNGSSRTLSRQIIVRAMSLDFSILSPSDGQTFSKTMIPVSGRATPGAEVTSHGMRLQLDPQGNFSAQVPIANEEGEYNLEFEASLEGKTKSIIRKVIYRPEYRFILSSPLERQVVNSTMIQVKGEVLPSTAEVNISGRRMSVSSNGAFTGYINIADEEGDVQLEIDITAGSLSRSETRTIVYRRPPDRIVPELQGVLPPVSQIARIPFTVVDRTIDEEITFYYEIDGQRESETGPPRSPFYVPLTEGIHNYSVWAVDKAKNQSIKKSQRISFLGTAVWSIRMRQPAATMAVINLPPSTPDGGYKPVYTVEFSIENLPNDNIQLIKEVTVTNGATGRSVNQRTFTDNYFQVDLELARNINAILIEALDINNIKKTQKLQIVVR